MIHRRCAAGVDVGGTKIFAGVVDIETGEVLATARKRTHPERGSAFFAQRLIEVIGSAIEAAGENVVLSGVGCGIAGQVDRTQGIILGAPNLAQGLVNFDVAALLSERFSLPVALANDVEIAALGELHFGAGTDQPSFMFVSVGTGIGGANVRDGIIDRGATGTAGEVGHTIVQYNGRFCGCGGRGHLEAYASRTAITQVLRAEMARGRASLLTEIQRPDDPAIRSKTLARCVEAGDALVLEVLTEAADYLGAGLGSVASLINPGRIILGGGLIEAVPVFAERATLRAREVALPVAGRALDIVPSALGDNAGIIGAAWLSGARASD